MVRKMERKGGGEEKDGKEGGRGEKEAQPNAKVALEGSGDMLAVYLTTYFLGFKGHLKQN